MGFTCSDSLAHTHKKETKTEATVLLTTEQGQLLEGSGEAQNEKREEVVRETAGKRKASESEMLSPSLSTSAFYC